MFFSRFSACSENDLNLTNKSKLLMRKYTRLKEVYTYREETNRCFRHGFGWYVSKAREVSIQRARDKHSHAWLYLTTLYIHLFITTDIRRRRGWVVQANSKVLFCMRAWALYLWLKLWSLKNMFIVDDMVCGYNLSIIHTRFDHSK